MKKLQLELQDAVKGILQRYQVIEKRMNQLQTPMAQPRLVVRLSTARLTTLVAHEELFLTNQFH